MRQVATKAIVVVGGKRAVRLPEKRVVTYSPKLARKQTWEINRQVKVLGDAFSSEDVMGLIRGLNVCQASERKYVNVSRRTPIVEELAERTGLPLLHFNLTKGDVRSISGCTLAMLRGKKKEAPTSEKAAREPHSTINGG